MARILALANQKGGVGKTTSAINLGAALAVAGRRVLLVDVDPQASLTDALGIDTSQLARSIYDVLMGDALIGDILQRAGRLTVAPATIDLAAADMQLINEVGRERLLADALAPVAAAFDEILIDCPPSLGLLTVNALTAADAVIIPVECHYMALRGLTQLVQSIEKIQRRANARLQLLGVLPTMYDPRTLHEHEVLAELQRLFPGKVYAPIRRSIRFAETALAGKPMLEYDPSHVGAQLYRDLAVEVLRAT
ncbi:MAG: ParA family protein [Chloroflexales bacterium]